MNHTNIPFTRYAVVKQAEVKNNKKDMDLLCKQMCSLEFMVGCTQDEVANQARVIRARSVEIMIYIICLYLLICYTYYLLKKGGY